MTTFSIKTFGCKVNQSETDEIIRSLSALGINVVAEGDKPDICIINSCAVTAQSERKARQFLRRAARENAGALIVLTGCGANTISNPPADIVVRQESKERIAEIIQVTRDEGRGTKIPLNPPLKKGERGGFISISSFGRTRAFIKIQDGCDNRCSYCVVSIIRNKLDSVPAEKIVDEINRFVGQSGKEAVLTGINMGKHEFGLTPLLRKIITETDIARLHLSSIEPEDVV